jgi:5-methyltetrahydropteroyltriglutamate--homocysteine methyltransferase
MRRTDLSFSVERTRFDEHYRPLGNTRITTNFANLARGEHRQENLRNTLRMIDNRFNELAHWDNEDGDRYSVELDIISVSVAIDGHGDRDAFPLIEVLQTTILDRRSGDRIEGLVGNNFSSYVRDYDFSVLLPEYNADRSEFGLPDDFGELHGNLFKSFLHSDSYALLFTKPPVICLSVSSNKTYQRTENQHPILGVEYRQDESSLTDEYFGKMGLRARYFMPRGSAAPLAFYHLGDLLGEYTNLELIATISTMETFQRIYRPEIYNANSAAVRVYRPSLNQPDFSTTQIVYDREERSRLAAEQGKFAEEHFIKPYKLALERWSAGFTVDRARPTERAVTHKLLPTSTAGSLPKPSWLAQPETLWSPWKLEDAQLDEGKHDALLLSLEDQRRAGVDIVSDGEQTRQHFVTTFIEHLSGVDFERRETVRIRDRYDASVPTVVGTVTRERPVFVEDARFLRGQTDQLIKWALPGPMTMIDTLYDAHYKSREKLAWEFAAILNQEARELEAAGVDIIQFDEPAFNVFFDDVNDWGVAALERAIEGLSCQTAVHICYGYGIKANTDWKDTLGPEWRQYEATFPKLQASSIDMISLECHNSHVPMDLIELIRGKKVMVGAIDVASTTVETPEEVADTLRKALQFVDADKLYPSTNCGMAPLPRGIARAKLAALGAGAEIVRTELAA